MPGADELERARTIALRSLSAAPRSRAELIERLQAKGIGERCAVELADSFERVGLIDDEDLARRLVRARVAERGLARRALLVELRRRRLPPGAVAAALEEVDDEAEDTAAEAIARRKLAATRGLDRDARFRRAAAQLARRGHSYHRAASIVSRLLAEETDDD